ncbi:hypothetical protein GCM10027610_066850 [Dactylosporangium cerinum]
MIDSLRQWGHNGTVVPPRCYLRLRNDGHYVYLLGHEELQQAAIHYLGPRLNAYRERIHAWADTYRTTNDRQPAWPPQTPEYLLAGYPHMLADTGEPHRLTALATDRARQRRLFDVTGGDTAALADIATASTLIGQQHDSGLLAALRLSWHRDQLVGRNTQIPAQLPAVWAALGQHVRAEGLARSIPAAISQAAAFTNLVRVATAAGDYEYARTLITIAEQAAYTITDPSLRASALVHIAEEAAAVGDDEHARTLAMAAVDIADAITHADARAFILAHVASRVAAATGDREHAEHIVNAISDPDRRGMGLTDLALEAAGAGDYNRARTLAARAERTARTIPHPFRREDVLAGVAGAVAAAGDHEHAVHIAKAITDPDIRRRALNASATPTGGHERAQLLDSYSTNYTARTQTDEAWAAAAAGDYERAQMLATQAEHAAHTTMEPKDQATALTRLARAAATVGDYERARVLATQAEHAARGTRSIDQVRILADVARAIAATGDHEGAQTVVTHAERSADSIVKPDSCAYALANLAQAAATAGDHERAERIARNITDPGVRTCALADLALEAAGAGDHQRARTLAVQAEHAVNTITEPQTQARALPKVVQAVAAAGDHEQARTLATVAERTAYTSITISAARARALAELAQAAATAGDHGRARTLAAHAERVARSIEGPRIQIRMLVNVAGAVAAAGCPEHAERIARMITGPDGRVYKERAQALAWAAGAAEPSRAHQLFTEALAVGSWSIPLQELASVNPMIISLFVAEFMSELPQLEGEPTATF